MRARAIRDAAVGLVVLLAASGCRESPAAANPYVHVDTLAGGIPRTITTHPIDSGRWRLVRARDIQPPDLDSAELVSPQDIAIGDDGSVLVVDARPVHIKIFDPSGRHVRSIGREGSGPGEFRSAYIAVRGDSVVAQDARNARATTFNWRTGEMLSERRTACCYFNPIGIDSAGRVVVRSILQPPDTIWRNAQGFVRFPMNGRTADTIFVRERQDVTPARPWLIREGNLIRMAVAVPYQPRAHYVVDPTGSYLTGWSGDYLFRLTRDGRDTVALFGREAEPLAVSAAEKQRLVDQRIAEVREGNRSGPSEAELRAAFDAAAIPDVMPAYEGVAVDAAGRRWVRRTSADTMTVRFDLFDQSGRWLDVVDVPAAGWPRLAWASVAWGMTEAAVTLEGDDGRPLVRVYRIERR
jgi:hypothetical protein